MRIQVTVKPNSRAPRIEKLGDAEFIVCVKAPPVDGRANAEVIAALAKYFGVKRADVELRGGGSGRKKWFEISVG